MKSIYASEISDFLGKELNGPDIIISGIAPISRLMVGAVAFAKKPSAEYKALMRDIHNCLVIVGSESADNLHCSYIVSENPRLDFIRVVSHFFPQDDDIPIGIGASFVAPGSSIGGNVRIGDGCRIGRNVAIGSNTRIGHNVVIMGNTKIGDDCYIKSGSVIGEEGFGFEYDEEGIPTHFPHLGRIEIGNDVFIGANSTIEIATIDITFIGDHVKIDDLVQIGHNCHIGSGTLIMAGAIICGGASIGEHCWIAPHTVIKEKTTIGDEGMTGLSTVVLKDIPPGIVFVGNPGRELRKR